STASPSMSSMTRSVRTMSYSSAPSAAMAAAPPAAATTWHPSASRCCRSSLSISRSLSAINTRVGIVLLVLVLRQPDEERGARVHRALDPDVAAEATQDVARDRQAQPGALARWLGAE